MQAPSKPGRGLRSRRLTATRPTHVSTHVASPHVKHCAARCRWHAVLQCSSEPSTNVVEQQPRTEIAEPGSAVEAQDDALELTVAVVTSIEQVPKEDWDSLVRSYDEVNPFLLWNFLHALEASKSAVREAGWLPHHLLVRDPEGRLLGACPMYLKTHSQGEYVFDHNWANFCERALGQPYYPKLQGCVPFTPVTGQRLLSAPGPLRKPVVKALGQAIIGITDAMELSGAHLTFTTKEEWEVLGEAGFLQRTGVQYHWENPGYGSFDDFLGDLRSNKRKSIKQERRSMQQTGLRLQRLAGSEVGAARWDRFYSFYLDTADKKWGTAYLEREFFHRIGETMPDEVLLVAAEESEGGGGRMVAGALNLAGSHALYGRNWGCEPGLMVKNLHFELCYYQALEEAIARKLPRVEAGAQGEHKMQRGYLPSLTYSVHYIRDEELRRAVARFLREEYMRMEVTWQALTLEASPFKRERTLETLKSKLEQYDSTQLIHISK